MDNKGTNPVRDAKLFLRYLRTLRRERPAAFLGYTIKPNVYGSLAAHSLGIPVINNVSGLGTAFIRDTWITRVVKGLYRLALRRSHTVFFQNEDDRRVFVDNKLVTPDRTALVPGSGIDLQRFEPADVLRRQQGFQFLLIARLLYDKGVGEFVDAARLIKPTHPEARCTLLGFLDAKNRTAVSRDDVDRWVSEGIIEYLGSSDDVRPFIAEADCVVLPSYREGTPRTLLEAAAMAKPLIATDVPGCREVVEDGQNGFLCRVKDARDLATKMIGMMEMAPADRRAMGEAGRQKMERQFDERLVIDAYLGRLEAAVGEGSSSVKRSVPAR
jgi:glycosyltransferase involved in cell wall biosynthesis